MSNSFDSNRIKAVVDLHDFIESIGSDRPSIGVFLKELNITPQTMQDAVLQTAHACSIAIPEAAFHIANHLFKLGVTIGYKYAIKKQMQELTGMEDSDDERAN
jgi:hypothetical protein